MERFSLKVCFLSHSWKIRRKNWKRKGSKCYLRNQTIFTCYTCPLSFPVFNTSKTSELQKAQNLKKSNVNFAQKRKIYWHYGEEAVVGIYFPVSNLKEWDSFPKKVVIKKISALPFLDENGNPPEPVITDLTCVTKYNEI